MFTLKKKIRLNETDATGVIYFTNLLKFATEAFEEFLNGEVYSIPIVSAKGTYLAPLFWNDEIQIKLILAKIGNSSFELHSEVKKCEVVAGRTEIVHVFTGGSIPSELRRRLDQL